MLLEIVMVIRCVFTLLLWNRSGQKFVAKELNPIKNTVRSPDGVFLHYIKNEELIKIDFENCIYTLMKMLVYVY